MRLPLCHSLSEKWILNPSICWLVILFLGWGTLVSMAKRAPPEPEGPPLSIKTSAEALAILRSSKNPLELKNVAIWLCQSNAPGALDQIAALLLDPDFLKRLDSEFNYGRLRSNMVLEAIGKVSTTKAEEVLLNLTQDKIFIEESKRVDGLIDACGWLRSPSPKVFAFLDSSLGSQSPVLVVRALARISSPESCALLEKRIVSVEGTVSDESSWGWFTHFLVPVRNKPAVVDLYKRVLSAKIQDAMCRNRIVQSLFDYRPDDWYSEEEVFPKPHPREEASPEVLKQLLESAGLALKLDISKETREGVLKAQKEIQEILQKRAAK